MVNLVRSAKSGSEWTELDLEAYNIIIQFQDATTFLGEDPLPPPAVDQELLEVQDADAMVSVPTAMLVNLSSGSRQDGPSCLAQTSRKAHRARSSLLIPLHMGCLG